MIIILQGSIFLLIVGRLKYRKLRRIIMTVERFLKSLDRRSFIKIVSITGISGLIYPRNLLSSCLPLDIVPIVVVEDETATAGYNINSATVQVMVDTAVMVLTQEQSVGQAWKSLFPDISSSSVIAVKVNVVVSSMPTHTEITYAVCEGLKQMEFDGNYFPENNIIIYDDTSNRLSQSGYTINTTENGIRCFGNSYSGYSTETYTVVNTNQRISRVVTEMSDYIVNIPVLKNHSTAGVTLALKNHLGTCNSPIQLHPNHCDPYTPALNALPIIRDKACVNVCDALFGIRSGGPAGYPQFVANKIIMSSDIVAGDCVGRDLLEDNGCNTIDDATHIDTAATDYNLGHNNPDDMEIINITNPSVNINDSNKPLPNQFQLEQNFPNPFNNNTQVRFYVPKSSEISIQIFNIQGQSVCQLVGKTLNQGWHRVVWDGKNNYGNAVSSGVYLCRMQAENFNKSIILEFVK